MKLESAKHIVLLFTLIGLSAPTFAGGDPKAKDLLSHSDCFNCHSVDHKIIGPAFKDIAKRYHGTHASAATINILAAKVIKGGNGNWNAVTGGIAMSAHPQLSMAQTTEMVKWVLAQ